MSSFKPGQNVKVIKGNRKGMEGYVSSISEAKETVGLLMNDGYIDLALDCVEIPQEEPARVVFKEGQPVKIVAGAYRGKEGYVGYYNPSFYEGLVAVKVCEKRWSNRPYRESIFYISPYCLELL